MDDERFDRWARVSHASLSRRGLGAVAAGKAIVLGLEDVAEGKKKRKKKKRKPGVSGGGCPACATNEVCLGNQCSRFRFVTKWGGVGSGEPLGILGGPGTGDGQFDGPWGVAVAGSRVYVSDFGRNRMHEFTTEGAHVATWSGPGDESGKLQDPRGITVDASGNVLVADSLNSRIQQFTAAGGFITKLGTIGIDDGQFSAPEDIATDAAGNIYVTESGFSRVKKYAPVGGAPRMASESRKRQQRDKRQKETR